MSGTDQPSLAVIASQASVLCPTCAFQWFDTGRARAFLPRPGTDTLQCAECDSGPDPYAIYWEPA